MPSFFESKLERTSVLVRSLLACGILALSFVVAHILDQYAKGNSELVLISATIVCALYFGFWIGMGTAVVAALGLDFFFQYPRLSFAIYYSEDVIQLAAFMLLAIYVSWVGAQLRKAKAQAEQASRAREDLLAIVAHDMRNPLNTIQLSTRLIEKDSADRRPPGYEKGVETIKRSAHRLNRLIQDILDYEKVRAGTIEIQPKPEPVRQLLDDVSETMRPLAESKSQQIAVDFQAGGSVLCDRDRILQVFSNLIGNSIKFMNAGGRIVIGCGSTATEFTFSVKDQGPGIPDQQLSNVFDRYWQARQTARQGTGLGLSIAKGIVEAHHGRIWAESKSGEGSTFYFTLPRAEFGTTKMGLQYH
jgi:signal transduction histidine kinase